MGLKFCKKIQIQNSCLMKNCRSVFVGRQFFCLQKGGRTFLSVPEEKIKRTLKERVMPLFPRLYEFDY